jgi:predicted ribosomally synthesized peptide with SipW-like signal peptide
MNSSLKQSINRARKEVEVKKKILFSIMVIALVGVLIGGGIYGYFSDVETSAGNTFTAGTLDLEVDNENPWTSTPITVSNMEPGAAASPVDITCENVGNLAGDLYLKITGVTDDGSVVTEPECICEGGTWSGGSCSGNTPVDAVSTKITLSCEVDASPVSGIDGVHLSAVPSGWTLIKDDLTGTSITLSLGGSLDSNADNCYQGDGSTFTIELYLAQDGQTPP